VFEGFEDWLSDFVITLFVNIRGNKLLKVPKIKRAYPTRVTVTCIRSQFDFKDGGKNAGN
jgi:hypothetical protein